MAQFCGLILNFAGGMEEGALWRLCASSRSGKPPQCFSWFRAPPMASDNFFSKMSTKPGMLSTMSVRPSTFPVKRLSTTSGKGQKSVNQNQEKTALEKHSFSLSEIKTFGPKFGFFIKRFVELNLFIYFCTEML